MSQASIQNRQNGNKHGVTVQITGDMDQLKELTKGASLELIQLSRGSFRSTLTHREFQSTSVHSNAFSLPVRGRGLLPVDRWTFVASPAGMYGTFNSVELAPDKVLVYPPGAEFDGAIHGADYIDWNFTVDDDVLRTTVRALYQCELPRRRTTCVVLTPDARIVKGLRRLAASLLNTDGELQSAEIRDRQNARLNDELAEQLARLLISGLTDYQGIDRRMQSHSRIVRRTEEFLSGTLNHTVTMTQLCEIADVSERTLRNAFCSVVGVGPGRFIKAIRLRQARMRLRAAIIGESTVAQIALQSGFSHLGHFSRDYREFFGERPSQTLAVRD